MNPRLAYKLCEAVYRDSYPAICEAERLGLEDVKFISNIGTQVLMGVRQQDETREVVVVFRGTKIDPIEIGWKDVLACRVLRTIAKSFTDIASDACAVRVPWAGEGEVHAGFLAALLKVQYDVGSYVVDMRPDSIHVAGHSLGGALAQLCGGMLGGRHRPVDVTTFGCPDVGDADACRWIERNCRQINNWVYCSDVVPRLLTLVPGYFKAGDTQYVDRTGELRFHATRLAKLVDRNILRLNQLVTGGGAFSVAGRIHAAFRQEVLHHFIAGWGNRKCLGDA